MRTLTALLAAAIVLSAVPGAVAQRPADPPLVQSIDLDVTIDPASADWVDRSLKDAEDAGAYLVIFRLDTPGGLDTSMRDIVKDIIAAPMPVVVYVSPNGARAASAGLFVTQAADVAAMAPQTNIGSATPISIGPGEQDRVLGRKIENDAAAYVRALAEGHGRNPDLAEEMVRKATNVPASVAKRRGLVDLVSADQEQLLRQLDGFRVKGPKRQVLHTAGAKVENRDIPFKYRLLELLVNPTTVFLLFTLGLIGIGFELFNPGAILPGSLGAVSLIIALYGLAQIPISVAGLLLILLAFGLFVAEAFIISHGALAVGGVISLIAGGLLLFDTGSDAFEISVPIVIFTAALLGGFFVFAISKAVQARHGRVRTGAEELIGERGVVRSPLDPVGHVFVQGALWRAVGADSQELAVGDEAVVEKVDGLTLTVRKVASSQ
jgi:membrane-bound serine protease (ClpP class)